MDRFFGGVIRHRRIIMVLFAAAALVCAFLTTKVYVDYDIVHYLPADSPSSVSLNVMKEEFGENIPNSRVVIRNVDRKEALEYKRKLEDIDGVVSVSWIDSMIPLNMPMEMYPESIRDSYFKDGNALFTVTIDESKQLETVPAIYDLIGEDNMLSGEAAITVVATINTVKEIILITIISILFLIFILAITTTSWFEPVIVMIGLGIAVVINTGTNLIFGKISFVTNSSGVILQMAVALDYSVFLIHRFSECRQHAEPEEAMKEALKLSTSSILSSGLTTVIGFLALATMKFLLGADLGLALSKGVAISLLTSLVFMPGLILETYKLMEKTTHRSFMPSFRKFGTFVTRVTVPMMIVFAIAVVPAFIGSTRNSFLYGASKIYGTDTRIGKDIADIRDIFGYNDSYVIMVPRGNESTEHALVRELKSMEKVKSVTAPVDVIGESLPMDILPDSLTSQLRSDKYDRIVLFVNLPSESEETFAFVENLYDTMDKYFPGEYYMAGQGINVYDLKNVVTADMLTVNIVAILSVFIVLLLTMKNLLLPVLLVLTIETAIWVNMSISLITGAPLYYVAYLIVSSVQLGATVDYAILYTQRYRENRSDLGLEPEECVIQTTSDTLVSILTSATAVSVMGFLLSIFSSQRIIAQVGLLLGRGTLCSLFAVLFVLPGLLMTFDRFIMRSFSFRTAVKKEKNAI